MILKLLFLIVVAVNFSGCLVGDTKCCEKIGTIEILKGICLARYRTFCAGFFFDLLTSLFQTIAECYDNNVFIPESSVHPHTSFKSLIQIDEEWERICKKNNPGLSVWDDYINSK